MACCGGCCAASDIFGSKVAERDLKRYRRRGPSSITRLLLQELRRSPLKRSELLDIGTGIGVIPAELADSVSAATLVEASSAYLDVARREIVGPRYGAAARFLLGDFVHIAETVPAADVVTLDRVVCCYPDAEAMLNAAAVRARRLLALSYPRERWYVRAFFAFGNLFFRLKGSQFRAFVHPPQRMREVLERDGLVHAARFGTFVWIGDVYFRRGGAN
jgi:2-polyprenyl-3-methyl-5-hydroxy-6-metoxy-1,4-benzoquinol methylase